MSSLWQRLGGKTSITLFMTSKIQRWMQFPQDLCLNLPQEKKKTSTRPMLNKQASPIINSIFLIPSKMSFVKLNALLTKVRHWLSHFWHVFKEVCLYPKPGSSSTPSTMNSLIKNPPRLGRMKCVNHQDSCSEGAGMPSQSRGERACLNSGKA